ncbi:DnaJ-domain-containing protein [Thermothelomyces heterothallicus CBS 203.75]
MASKAGRPPNYYAILEVPETASAAQIRDAYKRAALKTHPDRFPADHPERASRTRRFQLVNDAYYTLSDASRRRDYDAQRKLFSANSSGDGDGGDPFAEARTDAGTTTGAGTGSSSAGGMPFFSWAWEFFTRGQEGQGQGQGQEQRQQQERERERERAEDEQFADVFEEMLREEGMADEGPGARPTSKFWSVLGGLSGGALGFIVANVPGMVAGAVAGNRLGAVRDAKGKSVYAVFQELPQTDRARLLSQLAVRVLSHAAGV